MTFKSNSQTYVFAELTGSPNLNTTGWNLNGNAFVGDTPGDADNFLDELILTNAWNTQSGGVFYSTPIDPSVCSNWTVEFDYRIWGGSAADGIAFCFLDVPPTGFVSGGGVGIPGSANGLKVILDTWNNCGGPNPELQIYSGAGYFECAPGIVKLDNSAGNLGFVRSNNYQPVRITYNNGNVTLFVNNVQYLNANFPISFAGYMGFTASTGGANDQHSVKNVVIYTDQASSEAGNNLSYCTGDSAQLGTVFSPNFVYDWSPALGLNSTSSPSPTVNLLNNGSTVLTQMYTVSTSLASSPGVCPSTDSVLLTVYPNHQTSINTEICENESYSFGGQLYDSSGVYIDSIQSIYGCDSVVTLSLDVLPIYFDTIDVSICQNDNYVLGSQVLSTSGLYTEVFQSINGCDSSFSVNLTVNPLPVISCNDTLICIGDTATLVPNGAETYTWNPSIGFTSPDGTLNCSPTLSTSIELTGEDINSCTASEMINVGVQALPFIQIVSSENQICIGDSIFLTALGGESYFWELPIFQDATLGEQVLVPDTTVFIYLNGSDDLGCENSDSTIVVVFNLPELEISSVQGICFGESAEIVISGAQSYSWSPIGNGDLFMVTPDETTDFLVTATDINGCIDSIQTSVIVYPNPDAGLTASPLLTTSDIPHITFENTSSGANSYVLSTGDGFFYDFFSGEIEHSYPYAEGNYLVHLYVENEFGCKDSTQLLIQIKGEEIYYVPNTFTPDGDEHNNTFYAVFTSGYDPNQFEMMIYNRWGEELFKYLDSDQYWDGTYNGIECPEGTYIWRINYVVPETNESKTITGHLNLIR
ncbi:MAG: gliding motility-associated C-terminal domain-containing protein [Crocinitomicaceae bacterium]|nr:gliding motility-associated C-terminal domain-containing protein [Crocinitomicaceae bacterium]